MAERAPSSRSERYEAYIPVLRITAEVVRAEDFDRLHTAIQKALANLSPGTTAYEVLKAATP